MTSHGDSTGRYRHLYTFSGVVGDSTGRYRHLHTLSGIVVTAELAQPPGRTSQLQRCLACGNPMAGRRLSAQLGVVERYGYGRCTRCQRTSARARTRVPVTSGWRMRAACLGADPRAFDPIRLGGSQALPLIVERAATVFCAHCPVRAQCAAEADRDHLVGLWGGIFRGWRSGHNQGYRHVDLLSTRAVMVP